jgi:hypothetical protein
MVEHKTTNHRIRRPKPTEALWHNGKTDMSLDHLNPGHVVRPAKVDNHDWCPVRSESVGKPIAHWWVISAQDGPMSDAACRFCGKHKEFRNAADVGFSKHCRKGDS